MAASSRFGYNYRAIIALLRHYHLIIVIRSVSNQMGPIIRVLMMAPVSGWTKSGRQLIGGGTKLQKEH